jgi:hypothetical protein
MGGIIRAMPSQPPVALSMMICDAVQVDRGTGKTTNLGAFENVQATAYPARHPELTVFAELTDGRGQTQVKLKICFATADSLDGEELYSGTVDVVFPDPRFISRVILRIAPIDLPRAGEYRFILETDGGAFIAERRLVALTTTP